MQVRGLLGRHAPGRRQKPWSLVGELGQRRGSEVERERGWHAQDLPHNAGQCSVVQYGTISYSMI